MGIMKGCRSEMGLTGRRGKTARDERAYTYLLFTERDIRGVAVLENADPVTGAIKRAGSPQKRQTGLIANRKRFDFSK